MQLADATARHLPHRRGTAHPRQFEIRRVSDSLVCLLDLVYRHSVHGKMPLDPRPHDLFEARILRFARSPRLLDLPRKPATGQWRIQTGVRTRSIRAVGHASQRTPRAASDTASACVGTRVMMRRACESGSRARQGMSGGEDGRPVRSPRRLLGGRNLECTVLGSAGTRARITSVNRRRRDHISLGVRRSIAERRLAGTYTPPAPLVDARLVELVVRERLRGRSLRGIARALTLWGYRPPRARRCARSSSARGCGSAERLVGPQEINSVRLRSRRGSAAARREANGNRRPPRCLLPGRVPHRQ
jgi:hypothetical protein